MARSAHQERKGRKQVLNNAERQENGEIVERDAPTEFEVQALLWNELRRLGRNVRGEVKVRFPGGKLPRYPSGKPKLAYCRFDLAEFDGGRLVGIIEVKAAPMTHKSAAGWNGTRQGARYGMFGVPVLIVYGQQQAEALIADLEAGGDLWR